MQLHQQEGIPLYAWERSWHWHAVAHAIMCVGGWPAVATTLPTQFPGTVLHKRILPGIIPTG